MARREIMIMSLLLASLTSTGCLNSESDYQQLVEEKESLKAELAKATGENEILTEAMHNIRREQENLQILVNTVRSRINSETSSLAPGAAPLQPLTGDAPTISWGGWDWAIPPDAFPNALENGSPSPAAPPGGRIYRPKPGDVLSTIAARHNTSVAELVRLNPYLQRRNNFMIWETDEIVLP